MKKETIALNPVRRPKNNQQFMTARPTYKQQIIAARAKEDKNNG